MTSVKMCPAIIWNKNGKFWDWSARQWMDDPKYTPHIAVFNESKCLDASGDLGVDYDFCFVDPDNVVECEAVINHARKGDMGFSA